MIDVYGRPLAANDKLQIAFWGNLVPNLVPRVCPFVGKVLSLRTGIYSGYEIDFEINSYSCLKSGQLLGSRKRVELTFKCNFDFAVYKRQSFQIIIENVIVRITFRLFALLEDNLNWNSCMSKPNQKVITIVETTVCPVTYCHYQCMLDVYGKNYGAILPHCKGSLCLY
jgi:hypothetical protein